MNKNWYEISIKELFESFMRKNGYIVNFDTSNFFNAEIKKWTAQLTDAEKEKVSNLAIQAREYAFNKKYGTYNYQNDYRSECPTWNAKFLSKILQYKNPLDYCKVIAVGSNNGSELYQIFKETDNIYFDVVEISKTAILKGKKLFPRINFFCQSMDVFEPNHDYYDIYLNLRAAYCAGNDLDIIVRKAYNCLKTNGIMIFSISNGYIDVSNGNRIIVKGVYNPITKECSDSETTKNLEWVKKAILRNGFNNTEIYDIDSEILLISCKS